MLPAAPQSAESRRTLAGAGTTSGLGRRRVNAPRNGATRPAGSQRSKISLRLARRPYRAETVGCFRPIEELSGAEMCGTKGREGWTPTTTQEATVAAVPPPRSSSMPVFLGAARSRKQLQVVASGPVARELELYTDRASGIALMPEDEVHEAGRSDHGDVRSAQATARSGTSGTLTPGDHIPTTGPPTTSAIGRPAQFGLRFTGTGSRRLAGGRGGPGRFAAVISAASSPPFLPPSSPRNPGTTP